MVLADLGRKITSALRALSNATVINEEVRKCKQCALLWTWPVVNSPDGMLLWAIRLDLCHLIF